MFDVSGNKFDDSAHAALNALFEHLSSLKPLLHTLYMSNSFIQLHKLPNICGLVNLRELDISGCDFCAECVPVFDSLLKVRSFQSVSMNNCSFADDRVERSVLVPFITNAKSPSSSLNVTRVVNQAILFAGSASPDLSPLPVAPTPFHFTIGDVVKELPRFKPLGLRTLIIDRLYFTTEQLSFLVDTIADSETEVLSFSHPPDCMFEVQHSTEIAGMFSSLVQKSDHLLSLTLSNGFPESVICTLLRAIANSKGGCQLRHLNISGNNLGSAVMNLVEPVIRSLSKLLSLNIDKNKVDFMGFQVILHALQEMPDTMLCEVTNHHDLFTVKDPGERALCMNAASMITAIVNSNRVKFIKELVSLPQSLSQILCHLSGSVSLEDYHRDWEFKPRIIPEDILSWSSSLPYICRKNRVIDAPPPHAEVEESKKRPSKPLTQIKSAAIDARKSFRGMWSHFH